MERNNLVLRFKRRNELIETGKQVIFFPPLQNRKKSYLIIREVEGTTFISFLKKRNNVSLFIRTNFFASSFFSEWDGLRFFSQGQEEKIGPSLEFSDSRRNWSSLPHDFPFCRMSIRPPVQKISGCLVICAVCIIICIISETISTFSVSSLRQINISR